MAIFSYFPGYLCFSLFVKVPIVLRLSVLCSYFLFLKDVLFAELLYFQGTSDTSINVFSGFSW